MLRLLPYDPVDFLETEEDILTYLEFAMGGMIPNISPMPSATVPAPPA
jgi:hypothetical protein